MNYYKNDYPSKTQTYARFKKASDRLNRWDFSSSKQRQHNAMKRGDIWVLFT